MGHGGVGHPLVVEKELPTGTPPPGVHPTHGGGPEDAWEQRRGAYVGRVERVDGRHGGDRL